MNKRFFASMGISLAMLLNTAQAKSPHQEEQAESIVLVSQAPQILDQRYNYNLEDYIKYDSWVKKTIEKSRRTKRPAIIIDKAAYRLDLYVSGELKESFPVELGFNPFDDKVKEGDGTTPEGFYHTIKRKDVGKTDFYRAFLINYPNSKDRREFREAKKKGLVDATDTIGGAIEIHGHGSGLSPLNGGYNWTLGCMATANEQMDKIFQYTANEKGRIPVTIVKYHSIPIIDMPTQVIYIE